MPGLNRAHVSELRGATRLVIDATRGVTTSVERMHRTIARGTGPVGRATNESTTGLTGFVYRSIQGVMGIVGGGLDVALAGLEGLLPEGPDSASRQRAIAAINGVCGDHLSRTGNPLAIPMALYHRGHPISAHGSQPAGRKWLILIHGLCMDESSWRRNDRDYGQALAEAAGWTPQYLRYNSGQRVVDNGVQLSQLLEDILNASEGGVDEVALLGHSMGGLVARAAAEQGAREGHRWRSQLRAMAFLGTPHHGASLERGGHWLERAMTISPYTVPVLHATRIRSAGIMDLRLGRIDMNEIKPTPLPGDVDCFAVAGMLGESETGLKRFLGDGLVTVNSALGNHEDVLRNLAIPSDRQLRVRPLGHLELLGDPRIENRLTAWLSP